MAAQRRQVWPHRSGLPGPRHQSHHRDPFQILAGDDKGTTLRSEHFRGGTDSPRSISHLRFSLRGHRLHKSISHGLSIPQLPIHGWKTPGILGFLLSLSLLLAWYQRRRLLRFGASAFTANIWALAIILTGPLLTILVVFIERPRAYAPVTILGEEDAPPCLLKSA